MASSSINLSDFPHTLVKSKKTAISTPERFSLLLLEFGEVYFEDFSTVYYPNADTEQEEIDRKQRGRLKVCSQSIVFDPLDFSHPIIKIALRDCTFITKWTKADSRIDGGNSFIVKATQFCEMLVGNILAPYKFKKEKKVFVFSLNYGNVSTVLSQVITLVNAAKQPNSDQASLIDSLVSSRHAEVSFNTSWLEDLYEEHVLELLGDYVTPMVSNPGRIMLTSSRLYYQPYNNVESEPVLKVSLAELFCVMKRRYMLRHTGIELFCRGGSSMFLVLSSPKERNSLYETLLKIRPSVKLSGEELGHFTHSWQVGEMSNYDYLMTLNHLADRSFNDIMQYPVMPWIIADYTSQTLDLTNPATFRDLTKPIGALNPERLEFFKKRYSEMCDRKFLYGTHYSAPGYILYYLVRSAPEYLLCLQNGNFDKPNRLFHSIAQTWENVINDHADVKELVPEFYQSSGDFLLNTMNLDLGIRSDGNRVDNVIFPPWAKDAADFTGQCREALECDYVSTKLHHWIDLIFGYKQRGEEAVKADNVFHYLTYEGEFNIDRIHDPKEVAAIELQVKEFGQTPRQLFTAPHASRLTPTHTPTPTSHVTMATIPPPLEVNTGAETTEGLCTMDSGSCDPDEWVDIAMPVASKDKTLTLKLQNKLHKEVVSSLCLSHDGGTLFSVSHDKTLKVYGLSGEGELLRSASISGLPLSCIAVLPDSKCVLVGSWDNNVHVYSVEYACVVCQAYCHDSSITSLVWKNNRLVTGSWDSTVKVWDFPYPPPDNQTRPEPPDLLFELDHDNEVSCVDLHESLIASGTVDGYLTLWNTDGFRELELQAHSEGVTAIKFNLDGSLVCSCGGDGVVKLLDTRTHLEVISQMHPQPFHCVCWEDELLFLGGENGGLHVWEASTLTQLTTVKEHSGPVTAVSARGGLVATGSRDKCVSVWKYS